jgi:oligoribonuclease NrnB/cAMP/cGMP phosphodiesterase (DHH superfamily)
MDNLYNVSIINKYDIWLKEDEENPLNWMVMSKAQLQQRLKRKIGSKEEAKGRAIIGYDDIVWKKIK